MSVELKAEGTKVVEYTKINGKTYQTVVKVCRTEREAAAVANYYRLKARAER